MRNIKLTIAYDGSRYSGWQKQGNTKNTIQDKLENIVSKMVDKSDSMIDVNGSGRTDAGVHAKAQIANFKCETALGCDEIKKYINQYLPQDIRVISVEDADLRFHARLNAKKKTYEYFIANRGISDVFNRKYVWFIDDHLDIDKMKQCAKYFVGKHDFACFCDNKHMKKSTVRTVEKIEIKCRNNDYGGRDISISFSGDGFLYHMVRLMVATIVGVGKGEQEPETVKEIIETNDRSRVTGLAPAHGLFLMGVEY